MDAVAMYFYVSSSSRRLKNVNVDLDHFNSFCTLDCVKGILDGKLQCYCGEDFGIHNWSWSKTHSSSSVKLSNNNRDVLFHPLYSSGTAAVIGDSAFKPNLHYYWEIKMLTNLYGTDVMVGIGTSKMVPADWKFRFCSMLGIDSQSWGYSYRGNIQHNKLVRKYGSEFGLGSIIGVHLNMCKGTLEFHINRTPLGIAFTGLKAYELYPMVCSTAAQSAMRISCSVAEEPTLQMLCLEFISKYPTIYRKYKEIPGLTRLYDRKYFWIVPTDEEKEKTRLAKLENELMCPLNYKNFLKKNKKARVDGWRRSDNQSDSDELKTKETEISEVSADVVWKLPGCSSEPFTADDVRSTKIRKTDPVHPTTCEQIHNETTWCRIEIDDTNDSS